MLEINVKTIDGQNRSYSVPEDYTVRQFKEKITSSLNIPVDRQRLIFQGRELKDNNSVNELGVDGKTLHLVQRALPAPEAPLLSSSSSTTSTSSSSSSGTEGVFGNQDVAGLVQQLIGGLGGGQSTVTTTENGMEVHIDMNNISHQANENEIRSRIRNIRRFLSLAQSRLNRLQEIQSGAPLEDTAGSILIGSIHGTAQLSDANGTLSTFGFDIPNLNYANLNFQNLLAAVSGQTTQAASAQASPTVAPSTDAASYPASSTNLAPSTEQQNPSVSAETPPEIPAAAPTESASSTATPTSERSQDTQNIGIEVLGDVIQSVMNSYATFLPYLQQYHDMLVNDENEPPESPNSASTSQTSQTTTPNLNVINSNNSNIIVLGGGDNNRRQRFCNNINDMMHLLGHLFHNLSDLHINIRDRPPRQIHTMNSMQHTASAIISTRPIEANIQLPAFGPSVPGANTAPPRRFFSRTGPMPNWNPSHRIPINQINPQVSPQGILRPPQQRQASGPNNFRLTPDPSNRNTTTVTPGTPSSAPTANSVNMAAHQAAHDAAVNLARARVASTSARPAENPNAGISSVFNTRGPGSRGFSTAPAYPFMSGGNQAASPVTSYDPYLPCNSVHFYNSVQPTIASTSTSQRRRHPAGDQTANTTTTTTTTSTTTIASDGGVNSVNSPNLVNSQGQTTTIPLQNQEDPSHIMTQILSRLGRGISGGASQQVQVNIGGVPGQISIGTLSTSNVNPNNQLGASMFNIEQILGSIGAGVQQQPTAGLNQDPASNINSLIREAISLMDSDNTNDQRLNQPLTGLLDMSLGEDDEDSQGWRPDLNVPPTSTFSIFNVLFSSMTLGDMINLARGTSRDSVFERSRRPLRDHIKRYFPNSEETADQALNEENTQALIDRIYSEVFIDASGLNINLEQFELTDPNIDFPKSFEKLIKEHLRRMLLHVYDTTWDNVTSPPSTAPGGSQPQQEQTWSSLLFKKFHEMIERLVMLTRFSIRNADAQFTQIVTQKLRQAVISQSMVNNPMFLNIFDNFIQTQVQQTLTGIRAISPGGSEVKEFVIYKSHSNLIVDEKATTSSELNNVEDEDVFDDASSSLSSMDIDSSFNDYKKAHPEVSSQVIAKPKEGEKTVVPKITNWRDTLPKEWIEDINRDIQVQSSLAPRPPFSDAYCSGMPAKRRKVFTLRSDLQDKQIFKKVLGRTLEKIQLKQNASVESLVEDSLVNSQLINSFSSEFNTSVTERLKNDKDYDEILKKQDSDEKNDLKNNDRFSNSRKRFN